MIGTRHEALYCTGGILRVPHDVTAEEEDAANAHHDAAIVRCDGCGMRLTLTQPRRLPPAIRARTPPPDLSVFD